MHRGGVLTVFIAALFATIANPSYSDPFYPPGPPPDGPLRQPSGGIQCGQTVYLGSDTVITSHEVEAQSVLIQPFMGPWSFATDVRTGTIVYCERGCARLPKLNVPDTVELSAVSCYIADPLFVLPTHCVVSAFAPPGSTATCDNLGSDDDPVDLR